MCTRDDDGIPKITYNPTELELLLLPKEVLVRRLILAESLVTLYEAKLDKLRELQDIRELRVKQKNNQVDNPEPYIPPYTFSVGC